ncbi:MAG TPA: hypothetical protein ENK58_08645 [Desulfobacterales bacterium]|nr:hypothetical protein [Desulfobacterales bacterium]
MEKIRTVKFGIVIAVALFMITGCSASQLTGSSLFGTSKQKSRKTPVYHDFEDVLVPSELKIDKRSSFVYHTPGFSGGVLSLKGRVESNSLIAFFESNMLRDNWRMISSFKSPRTIILFHKESKWCVISISEKEFSTYVEIWVAPTINEVKNVPGDGLMK